MEKARNGINTETVDSILGSQGTGTKKANVPYVSQFHNTHIENIAMSCPMCIVAKNRIETFKVYEIKELRASPFNFSRDGEVSSAAHPVDFMK